MSDFSYLLGKVQKHALPVYQGPAGSDAPARKRLLLPQGELAQFYDGETPIHYMAFIELRAGTVRGNHYHRQKEEWIYLIRGAMQLVLEDVESKTREVVPIQAGELVSIQTGVAHALRISAAGQAVEFSPTRFDAKDTYRYPLA